MTYQKTVNIGSPLTAFGELLTASNRPIIQATGVYDVTPVNFQSFSYLSGSATPTGRMLTCNTGTTAYGYGGFQTIRSINYRAGQAGLARFTGVFTQGVANSGQIAGLITIGDGYMFGFENDAFGIAHRRGGLAECRRITVTLQSSGSTNLTLTLNSVAYTIPLTAGTTAHNAYEIATWLGLNQTIWAVSQNGATVVLLAESDGAKSGTYTYSHATSTGTIDLVRAGVTKTETWVHKANWNVNTMPNLDPTKGNVYAIAYQYLGFGDIFYYVENPNTGRFQLVHRIEYANAYTTPSVGNPSLRMGLFAYSLGSTTNLITQTASMSGIMQGERQFTRNPRSYGNLKSVSTTETNIFTLRNRMEFNGYHNQGEMQPLKLTLANNSTKIATFYLRGNATMNGEPNWSYVNQSNLISEVDIAGTTVSAVGTPIGEFYVAPNSTLVIDLIADDIRIPPTVRFTLSGKVSSGAASDLAGSLSWYEDVF